ncbi:hypothetical protein LZ32DRAFT_691863 [Colletotrichum eremochloae]|nr:hypothetical protein LZ32DRAFT_691863 [Colletotrichum eremochloae]
MASATSKQFTGNQPAGTQAKINRTCDLIRAFYTDQSGEYHPTAVDEATLRTFLTSDKICSPRPGPSDYLDDYRTKMSLIPQMRALVQNDGHPALEQASFWAALWCMPASDILALIHELQTHPILKRIHESGKLQMSVKGIPQLLKIFRGTNSDISTKDNSNTPKKVVYKRDKSEVSFTLRRDKELCVITGTLHPQVCHIFPFSSLNHQERTKSCLLGMTKLWGEDRVIKLNSQLVNDGTGKNIVDTAANMISLSPQLHAWWSRGYFALEPMEAPEPVEVQTTTPTRSTFKTAWRIKLRFHWLQKTSIFNLLSTVNYSDDPVTKFEDLGCNLNIVDARTWRPVESGQVITITADSPEHLPNYDILLLQWDLLRMWRLSGGADPSNYPFDDEYDSDEETGCNSH